MPERTSYKIIIIGAGITGLSTGLAWTRVYSAHDHPALIIEKQPVPGGCVATFARKGYRFDTVQIIPDVTDILRFFEIDINLVRFNNYYARLFLADPGKKEVKVFPVASDIGSFMDFLIETYPEDKEQIRSFFEYCGKMHEELRFLKTEPGITDIIKILFRCKKILSNSGKTYRQFLEKFKFRNNELVEVLDIFSSFSGLSGNRCASLLTACAMVTTLKGSYRPEKGFIQFPLSLKKAFVENGGEVVFNTSVKRILTEGTRAIGVELDDGQKIYSDIVVTTADTKVSLGKMLGYDILRKAGKNYALKARKAGMSPSGFAIHLGLDDSIDLREEGFDCGYNVLTTGRSAHEKMFDAWEKEEIMLSDECFHLAAISPSVQTGGKPNLIIHVVPVPARKWIELRENDPEAYKKQKYELADFYIQKVDEYMIPGIKEHISFVDVATPATYARYIGSPSGSNYDMMPVPGNFGKNRLKTRTPVRNLFLPKFSHGIWPSLQAGLQVVDMISGGKIMQGNSSYS